jgi:hypothetical protein
VSFWQVLRPSTCVNQANPEAGFSSNFRDNQSHKHPPQRSSDSRPFGVHFHEGDAESGRGMLRRTNAHDGMEARLLAKTVELEKASPHLHAHIIVKLCDKDNYYS